MLTQERLIKPWKPSSPVSYIFTNANLVDPVDGCILEGVTLKISAGLVEDVKPPGAGDPKKIPEGLKVVDLQGKYLCPGLSLSYTHYRGARREGVA